MKKMCKQCDKPLRWWQKRIGRVHAKCWNAWIDSQDWGF